MANNHFLHQTTTTLPSVAQVKTIVITAASSALTAVWTATLTNSDSSTETVSYTEDGSPTTTEIKDGLVAAWNASVKPHIQQITAASTGAATFTLTADTAGVPLSVALADSSDGTHTETATTANQGVNDVGTAGNWELAAVPANTNDLIWNTGSVAVKYGLNISSITLADVRILPGCSSQFGLFEFGKGYYFRIDPDLFRYEGSASLAMFDIGSANISPYVASTGTASSTVSQHAFYITGSNIATLFVDKGNVGLAVLDADTATVATVDMGYVSTLASDANVTIGSGVTLTTLNQRGGVCVMKCAATTVNVVAGATLSTYGTGAITTLNIAGTGNMYATGTIGTVKQSAGTLRLHGTATTVTNAEGATLYTKGTGTSTTINAYGTCYLNSSGTITTLNCYGTVDLTQDRTARTITTTNLAPGCRLRYGSHITFTNPPFPIATAEGDSTLEFVG